MFSNLQLRNLLPRIKSAVEEKSNTEGEVLHVDEEDDLEEQQQQLNFDLSTITDRIKAASEGAISKKTLDAYRRYVNPTLSTVLQQ